MVLDLDKTVLEQEHCKGVCPTVRERVPCVPIDGPPKPTYNRIHIRPGWETLKKRLLEQHVLVFVRTHASIGEELWEHLDPTDKLKVSILYFFKR